MKRPGGDDSNHGQPVAENLLKRDFTAEKPNQRWVGDTTELRTPQGKLYLAVILDLFSRFVVGWALSALNDRHVTMKALDMALRRRCPDDDGLLHHSDQGSTYACEDFANPSDAKEQLFDFIEVFYNQTRMHSTLDYCSPAEFERNARASELAA